MELWDGIGGGLSLADRYALESGLPSTSVTKAYTFKTNRIAAVVLCGQRLRYKTTSVLQGPLVSGDE